MDVTCTSNEIILSSKTDEWRKICRICLGNNSKLVWLFDSFKSYTLSHYINDFTNVKISRHDQLPCFICIICVKELESVLAFKEKCEKSDKYLHDLLNQADKDLAETDAVKKEVLDSPVKQEDDYSSDGVDVKEEIIAVDFPTSFSLKPEKVKKEKASKLKKEKAAKIKKEKAAEESKLHVKRKRGRPKKSTNSDEYQGSGLYCAECNKTFPSEAKRKLHWYGVHKNKKTFKCETCHKNFRSEEAFDRHVNKGLTCKNRYKGVRIEGVGKDRMYFCTACDYKKKTVAEVYRHYVIHTGEHPYACHLCTKAYTSRKSLTYHKETVHKIYKVKITCHLCGKVVEGTHRFNRHFRFTHPNNQYQCDLCKVFLKSKWGLVCHLKTHEDVKEYVCETCGSAFKTSLNLRNHIRFVHEKHQFPCHLCAYKTKCTKGLKSHILQHSQDKLQCNVCFRFFDTPLKLIKHMEMHGEKKHFCLYCNKGFVRKKDCSQHERLIHIKKLSGKYLPKPSPISEEMNVCE